MHQGLKIYLNNLENKNPEFPIKFNGLSFVNLQPPNANFRTWGGCNWWQNTRLPYGNMLAAGDYEGVRNLLQYFLNMEDFATNRTQIAFDHDGIYFTEVKTVFGAFAPADYGCEPGRSKAKYPVGLETNQYIHLDYAGDGGTTEITWMMLDYFQYTNDTELLTSRYLPFIRKVMDFFFKHYSRDKSGMLHIYPSQALEMYWCKINCATGDPKDCVTDANNCVTGDAPTIAALKANLKRLTMLDEYLLSAEDRDFYEGFLKIVPELPLDSDGKLDIAQKYADITHNSETPELYAVHPYRMFSVPEQLRGVDASPAIKAWMSDKEAHGNSGWNQGIMNAALLGLTENATRMLIERAQTKLAEGFRWPGFAPHFQDFQPSADHYANYNTALQTMLLQNGLDDKIVLFGAWPCEWDVSFRLMAAKKHGC